MDGRRLNVLVVDDDPAPREFLRPILLGSGCDVQEAGNGREALALLQATRPDMIITDWKMPVMDGIELVRAVRAGPDGGRPYIILITSLEDEDTLVQAFDAGVDDFFGKPLRRKVVDARLRAGQRIVRLQRAYERHIDELQRYSQEISHSNLRLRELAITDELTGLPNRRYALERMQQAWASSSRNGTALSCMVIDLAGLQQINDAHGDERGDVVLKTVAALMRKMARAQDVVCRIGGDEFLVIFPGSALDSVMGFGERLIGAVGEFRIQAGGCPFGLSIGAAERQPDIATPEELLHRAEQSMRHAKQHGKNQVYSEQEEALGYVSGLSDVCQVCKIRGRRARGTFCSWQPIAALQPRDTATA